MALLHQHGRLTGPAFAPATRLVDKLAEDFVRKYDAVRTPPHYHDTLDPEHQMIATVLTALNAELRLMLQPHMTEKNLAALSEVLTYFGAPASMRRFISEPACFAELGKIAEILRIMYAL